MARIGALKPETCPGNVAIPLATGTPCTVKAATRRDVTAKIGNLFFDFAPPLF